MHDQPDTAEVNVLVEDDSYIRDLNRDYRGVDSATDVLSFALNDPGDDSFDFDPDRSLLGDIVISLDTARRQAAELGHSVNMELLHLLCHGTLHLLGYDHMKPKDRRRMFALHKQILAEFLSDEGCDSAACDDWYMDK